MDAVQYLGLYVPNLIDVLESDRIGGPGHHGSCGDHQLRVFSCCAPVLLHFSLFSDDFSDQCVYAESYGSIRESWHFNDQA